MTLLHIFVHNLKLSGSRLWFSHSFQAYWGHHHPASQKMISMKKKKKVRIAVFYFNLYFYAIHVTSDHISVSETPSYNYTWPQLGAAWCSTSTFLGRKSTMFILVKNEKSLLNCALFFLIVFTSSFHSGLDLFSSYLPSLNKMEVSWEQVLWVFSTSAEKWW